MSHPVHPLSERIQAALNQPAESRALEFDGSWYQWGDVRRVVDNVDRLVSRLAGAEAEAVGVMVRNTPVHVAMLINLLRRGQCFVVINPAKGEDYLRSDLDDLRLPLVIGASKDIDRVRGASAGTTLVGFSDDQVDEAAMWQSADPWSPVLHHGIAVRMLTSGTTGVPKRIDLAYEALHLTFQGVKHFESRPSTTLPRSVGVVNSPLAHLGGVFRVLMNLLDQRPFVLLERFEVEPWLRAIRTYRPKTASLVPTALRMVLEADPDPADLASLRSVISGTAPLSPDDADEFLRRYGVPVLSSYAATEFAGGAAGWTVADHREWWERKRGSVGRAMPGCALRVVDEDSGEVLSTDQVGLLEVRPAQLGQGSAWMRTTDLARLDDDGFLFIVGRADDAIIRGGFKVLPDQVRAVLEAHPAVRQSAVLGVPDARLGEVPVALLELRDDSSAADHLSAIEEFAAARLARYEVPTRYLVVDELPRSPIGKVDINAARALVSDGLA